MTHSKCYILYLLLLTCLVCSCQKGKGPAMKDAKRSVYYWRTTYSLSKDEKAFLSSHNIARIYLRLFDVVKHEDTPKPDATLVFKEKMPKGCDVVPVVFITNNVLTNDTTGNAMLAMQIVRRVTQMMQTHNISWHELQIDFDWTQRNQTTYFTLLNNIRQQLAQQKDNTKRLSATIRLHQLSLTPPPVDYGALMVYNIGNYNSTDEQNSILSINKLKPYLTHLADYPIPLATALPLYSWDLAFQNGKFMGIARGLALADTATYYHVPDSHDRGDLYMVKRYHVAMNEGITLMDPGLKLFPGCVIRHEECSPSLLQQVYNMLSHERSNALDEVILYHLDNNNIKRYTHEQIENLLGSN